MTNIMYGYARVSTKDQNEARQVIAMREFGVEERHIFLDKQSGKDFNRPQYKRLLRKLKAGDTLVIKSMPSDLKRYIEEKSISQENINEYLINYLYLFPFMLACNFAIDYNGQLQFRNEYVIPQLITHALRNISCKGKEKVCCIRYLSVKNKDCINYAFFSPEIRVKERYSNYLTNIMIWCIPEPLVNGKIYCTGKKNVFNYTNTRKEYF